MKKLFSIKKHFDKDTSTKQNKNERSQPDVKWRHSWSTNEMLQALEASHFKLLPNEVILQIFKFLSVHDLGNVSLVCRAFKIIADQDDIWKLKCKCKLINV